MLASSSTLFFRLSRQLKYPLIYSNTSLLERVQRELFHVVTRCLTPLMSDASCSCVYRLVLVYKILFIWIFLFFTSHSSFTLMMLCDSGLKSCSQLVSSLTIRVLIMKNYVQHLHTLFLSSGTSHTWTLQLCDFVSFFFHFSDISLDLSCHAYTECVRRGGFICRSELEFTTTKKFKVFLCEQKANVKSDKISLEACTCTRN